MSIALHFFRPEKTTVHTLQIRMQRLLLEKYFQRLSSESPVRLSCLFSHQSPFFSPRHLLAPLWPHRTTVFYWQLGLFPIAKWNWEFFFGKNATFCYLETWLSFLSTKVLQNFPVCCSCLSEDSEKCSRMEKARFHGQWQEPLCTHNSPYHHNSGHAPICLQKRHWEGGTADLKDVQHAQITIIYP